MTRLSHRETRQTKHSSDFIKIIHNLVSCVSIKIKKLQMKNGFDLLGLRKLLLQSQLLPSWPSNGGKHKRKGGKGSAHSTQQSYRPLTGQVTNVENTDIPPWAFGSSYTQSWSHLPPHRQCKRAFPHKLPYPFEGRTSPCQKVSLNGDELFAAILALLHL